MTEKQLIDAINAQGIAGIKATKSMSKQELDTLFAIVNRPEASDAEKAVLELQSQLAEKTAEVEELTAANAEISKALSAVEKSNKADAAKVVASFNGVKYAVRRGVSILLASGNCYLSAEEIAKSEEALERLVKTNSPILKRIG